MALIKCPECKKEISDKSKTCIHCGCPVENETKYYCEECGKKILKTDKVCSNCGCPTNLEKKQNKSNFLKEKLSKYLNNIKTKNKKTIVITCISIAIILFLIIFIFSRETIIYRMNSSSTTYESITLQSFGKCYYYYDSHYDDSKDEIDSNCSWSKKGSSYTITISGKVLYCSRNGKDFSCKYNDTTLKYTAD